MPAIVGPASNGLKSNSVSPESNGTVGREPPGATQNCAFLGPGRGDVKAIRAPTGERVRSAAGRHRKEVCRITG